MRQRPPLTSVEIVLLSWLAAIAAFPGGLFLAAVGQGSGALLGGCTWIGVCLPLNRPVWALVNEPSIAFASFFSAWGYWLGSTLLPLIVAALAISLLPRKRRLGTELALVQLAWAAAAAGVAGVQLIGVSGGHVRQWLALRHLPPALVWLLPIAAAAAVVPASLRLLALDREAVPDGGRVRRLWIVFLHLVVPSVAWLTAVSIASGGVAWQAVVALLMPIVGALVLAWAAYPSRLPYRFENPSLGTWVSLALAAALAWGFVALAGRPLPGGDNAALLWGRPLATNNVRVWMQPVRVPWLKPDLPPQD